MRALPLFLLLACNPFPRSGPARSTGALGVGDACVSTQQCGPALVCVNGACEVKLTRDGDAGTLVPNPPPTGDDDETQDGGEDDDTPDPR